MGHFYSVYWTLEVPTFCSAAGFKTPPLQNAGLKKTTVQNTEGVKQ